MTALNWFEIPVADLDRATSFYERLLGIDIVRTEFMSVPHGLFPAMGSGGALVLDPANAPSATGSLLYLATDALDSRAASVAALGGTLLAGPVDLGDQGAMVLLLDSEGNRVALHSR